MIFDTQDAASQTAILEMIQSYEKQLDLLIVVDGNYRNMEARITHLERLADYYRSAIIQQSRTHKPPYVPCRIHLPYSVSADFPFTSLVESGDYGCESNQYGAVSVIASDGRLLGVKLDEFEVLEWRANQ